MSNVPNKSVETNRRPSSPLLGLLFLLTTIPSRAGETNVSPWTLLFKGVEHSFVRVVTTNAGERSQAINCLRVDLTDPDIVLFTTPKCTLPCTEDTINQPTSHFLESYGLQVAVNGAFSSPSDGEIGHPADVEALAISQGILVSPQLLDDGEHNAQTVLLFTTDNVPTYIPTNWPPVDTTGIYTGIGGNPLLIDGVNVAGDDDSKDPRTALGISQDNRYLYMMTVDGRQPEWAENGMTVFEAAEWLAFFGAYNGLNLDGGGSTTMSMADCKGYAIRVNRPSFVAAYGRERRTGHNFGVYARPAPSAIKDLNAVPGTTTAVISWRTDFEATTQVESGLTTNYGTITRLDTNMIKTHVVNLAGLLPDTNYFFRVISSDGMTEHSLPCRTATLSELTRALVFDITNLWRFTTNNLDGVSWMAPAYDDSTWLGAGPGLLYVESNSGVVPKNTEMPPGASAPSSSIPRTYYFRTDFQFSGSAAGLSVTFSNYIDDGAVFYLNGAEIYRVRMQPWPTVITNLSTATARPCDGDATCADLFTITGDLLTTNLAQGTNIIAVEVHDQTRGDIVFGSALIQGSPVDIIPRVYITRSDNTATLYWNGEGFTLQHTTDLSATNSWNDMPGPVNTSPAVVTNAGSAFYRLRRSGSGLSH